MVLHDFFCIKFVVVYTILSFIVIFLIIKFVKAFKTIYNKNQTKPFIVLIKYATAFYKLAVHNTTSLRHDKT